ncbi:MAG: PH domain-containing protein [Polaribacter sp.]
MADAYQNNTITIFPDISKVDFIPIQKEQLYVVLLTITLIFIVLFSIAFCVQYYNFFEMNTHKFWVYAILSFLFVFLFFIKIISFKKRKYAVREKDISYKSGIFFKSLTTVPFNRIQHMEIDQGPIARFFDLASISIFTAGDSSDDLKIDGLLKENAQQIKEFISNKIDG